MLNAIKGAGLIRPQSQAQIIAKIAKALNVSIEELL